MKLSLSNKSNLNSNFDNLYKNINLDRTKNKQRKKETHVENRTQKRKKKKDLVVFEWYLITNLPRLGFIFTLSSLYLVHVSILFFSCIFIPIFYL